MSRRLGFTVMVTCAVLALAAATTAAETLQLSPARELTLTSLGGLSFEASGVTIRCNVTLSGSFRSGSFASTRGTVIGSVTRATVSGCSGGTITPLVEARAPWNLVYEAVDGSFPEAADGYVVRLEGIRALAGVSSFYQCLYTASLAGALATTYRDLEDQDVNLSATTGLLSLLSEQHTYSRIERLGGIFSCSTTPSITGSFSVAPQQTVTQLNTALQVRFRDDPILYAPPFPAGKSAELINIGIRPISIQRVYKSGGQSERFTEFYSLAGQCSLNDFLGSGQKCDILISFAGPAPASTTINVDINESDDRPAAAGTLGA